MGGSFGGFGRRGGGGGLMGDDKYLDILRIGIYAKTIKTAH